MLQRKRCQKRLAARRFCFCSTDNDGIYLVIGCQPIRRNIFARNLVMDFYAYNTSLNALYLTCHLIFFVFFLAGNTVNAQNKRRTLVYKCNDFKSIGG